INNSLNFLVFLWKSLDYMKPIKQGLYSPEYEHDNCGAGFICNLNGERTNDIIHKAPDILIRLEHRRAVNDDGKTGDGAGILIDIPHDYFKQVCDFEIPPSKEYAVGMLFLPKSVNQSKLCMNIFEQNVERQGLKIIGWRDVPVDKSCIGTIAAQTEPTIKQ